MILILSLCLVGLMFLVIILVICIARDRRRRTGEGVGRVQGGKKEAKKPENVVLVDVTQVDGKQGDAPQAAEVKANEPPPKVDGSIPKEAPAPSNINGNPAPVGDKQETLLQVAEANARPIESPLSANVADKVPATDNNSNKNETSAPIVEPIIDKTLVETPAELEKQAPPAANQAEVPGDPEVNENLVAKPNVQLHESALQDILKEAFGEGNN